MKRRVVFGAGGVIVAVLSVLAAAAVGAFAAGGSPNAGVAARNNGIAAPSVGEVASFPVLGQAATATSEVSPQVLGLLESAGGEYHPNPSLGRTVVNNAVATAAVVPAEGAVCFVVLGHVGGSSSICEPEAGAAKEGLGVVESVPNGKYVTVGVQPTSEAASTVVVTDAAGKETRVELTAQNGYAFESSSKPVAMHWINSSRTHSTLLPKE